MPQTDSQQSNGLLLAFQCRIEQRGTNWLASCDELGVSDHGSSLKEARNRLLAALDLFLNDCGERGVLEDVLKARDVAFVKIPVPASMAIGGPKGNRLLTSLSGEAIGSTPTLIEQLEILVPASEIGKVHAGLGSD
jgi:predicted RNase H-like HicB family nuclease